MISIVYMSTSTVPVDDDLLVGLLRDARLRNEALGVSGLLLAKDGRFMQLLEGPEMMVQDRFTAITRDPRHTDIRSIVREEIDTRRFDGWAMAYVPLVDSDVRTEPGFSGFLDGGVDFRRAFDRTSAAWLLKWFRDRDLREV